MSTFRFISDITDEIVGSYSQKELARLESLLRVSIVAKIEVALQARGIVHNKIEATFKNIDELKKHVWMSLPRKLIITDLDNTLWSGIASEDTDILPNDKLQNALFKKRGEGILLAIASKNDERFARQIFALFDMPLEYKHFSAARINYGDKAENIVEIAAELNLGLSSIVFIDDMPHERDRVETTLPQVLVIHPDEFEQLNCWTDDETWEDYRRADMYEAEKKRQAMISLPDWWSMLGLEVTIKRLLPDSEAELKRAWQLLTKTNQMNLRNRRPNIIELAQELNRATTCAWVFSASDRFGDYGIIGVASVVNDGKKLVVRDFVLSCRAMGRRIEDVMFNCLVDFANRHGVDSIVFTCDKTDRNEPMQEYAQTIGSRGYPPKPAFIKEIQA